MPQPELTGFIDDGSPLTTLTPDPSPLIGVRAVRDDDLPRLHGYGGQVRLVVTSGAGQVAGPAAWCRRHQVRLGALDITLRDPADPAGNAHRLLTAVRAATETGDLPDDVLMHVRVAAEPTPAWLRALDVLAEDDAVVALDLDAGDPEPWIDAALDRETAVSLLGGDAGQAVAALRTTARLWGDPDDLAAARRWCRSWLTTDTGDAVRRLHGAGLIDRTEEAT